MTTIRPVDPQHADVWLAMRHALWPDEPVDGLRADIEAFFAGGLRHLVVVLLAFDDDDAPIGFAGLDFQPYAERCTSDRVAFLAGWYVEPAHRRGGVGSALIAAPEQWARNAGCTEFASDALHDNRESQAAHLALGFEEVAVIRCFRKDLQEGLQPR